MKKRPVRETAPIQVYLDAAEHARLVQLAEQLATTKSGVLRRGLLALERDTLNPETHPALRLIGLVSDEGGRPDPTDAARDHDQVLADGEEAAWAAPAGRKPPRRGS